MAKSKAKAEFGDFQTPSALARQVCAALARRGIKPASLIEPTCGLGRFLFAGLDEFTSVELAFGLELNPRYVERTNAELRDRPDAQKVSLVEANFFATDWKALMRDLPEPILILGNPPWVTNSQLSSIRSKNVPQKSNFQNHNGLDAMTGKSNFDISEWMLIQLMQAMDGRRGVLAMLCKSTTSRKVFSYACSQNLSFRRTTLSKIDADFHFDAAVSADLLAMEFEPSATDHEAWIYTSISATQPETVIGYEDDILAANIQSYRRWKHLAGGGPLTWRSGIKHDCSKVIELRREAGKYRNGLGEVVELEDDFVYPMLKSSDLAAQIVRHDGRKFMLVTQQTVGSDTSVIRDIAPKTWSYLMAHEALFTRRGSAIYKNRPQFSVFGVGRYSFTRWKLAISGFYKRLNFAAVGPAAGKPCVLDDTSYFLPCDSQEQVECLSALLNSPVAQSFYNAFVFWDSKRPITAEILRRLNLELLAHEIGKGDDFQRCFSESLEGPACRTSKTADRQQTSLPFSSD